MKTKLIFSNNVQKIINDEIQPLLKEYGIGPEDKPSWELMSNKRFKIIMLSVISFIFYDSLDYLLGRNIEGKFLIFEDYITKYDSLDSSATFKLVIGLYVMVALFNEYMNNKKISKLYKKKKTTVAAELRNLSFIDCDLKEEENYETLWNSYVFMITKYLDLAVSSGVLKPITTEHVQKAIYNPMVYLLTINKQLKSTSTHKNTDEKNYELWSDNALNMMSINYYPNVFYNFFTHIIVKDINDLTDLETKK